jgi:hypothetical protein
MVIDGLGPKDMQAFSFLEYYAQYNCLVECIHNLQQPSSRMLQILSMAKRIGYELLNNISNSNT